MIFLLHVEWPEMPPYKLLLTYYVECKRPWIAQYWRFHCEPKTTTVSAKLNWIAYSELPWRPFLGHQARSWTTLRRRNVFITFTNVFKKKFLSRFYVFNVFVIFIWTFLRLRLTHGSVGPAESTSQWALRSVHSHGCDQLTDTQTTPPLYQKAASLDSVHAVWPKNYC